MLVIVFYLHLLVIVLFITNDCIQQELDFEIRLNPAINLVEIYVDFANHF